MDEPRFAGSGWSRRVKLVVEETIEFTPRFATRLRWLGYASNGILTLTSHRLIWTPYPVTFDFFSWFVRKDEIRDVSAGQGPWWPPGMARETVAIATVNGTRKFLIGMIGQSDPENWAYEIRRWAGVAK